ncbi:MAG: hypothetical protein HRT89_12085, partial [Lentisphaeria bacterium]|nr:hypothetical protein [Lentisphaeria bacterium]
MGLDIGLPENLQLKLKSFEKRLKLYETLFVILGALSGAAFSWLILYVSDRFWDTAIIFRILISVSAILCAAAFSYFWLFHWIFHKRNLRQLASIIQSEHQILGDRLQGIVELVEQSDIHDISPALIRAAIRKVASEADDLEFTDAVDKRGSRKAFTICTVLAVFVVSLMVFNVHAGVNAFQRWAMPTADIPRYTFVSVEALPDTLYVPHGEAFTIEIFDIKYDDASFFKPTEAEANCSNQAILEVSIHKNRARFEIPGQTEQISLFLSVGDYDKTIKVEPLYRPVLKDLTAYIVYPEYLERGQNLQKVSAGYFSVLEKSTVSFKASFSRAIKAASFSNKVKTKIDNDHFLSDKYEIAKAEKIEIGFTDIHGLKPQKNYVLNLQVRKDKMPIVEFPDQAASVAILINESVEMSIEASDDFGLKYLTLEWDIYDLQERKRHHETYKQILLKGGPYKDKLKRTFIFSPEQMKIPDQTMVILKAKAKDYNPNSKAAYSMERKIYILSYEEHEKLIRKRFEELQTQLEEQIRQEENQKHDTEDMAKKKDLKDSKHNDKIAELSKNESANRREIERIVQKGMKLLKEALRNKNISESMIREWAKMLNGLKNIKSSEMKSAQGKLNKALKNPPSRNEDMKKAAENMAEAIKKMQKLLKNLDKSLEQMTAMNFVNRLKAMARKEGEIKRDLKAIFADTIGANKDDLDAKYKKVLSKQAVS